MYTIHVRESSIQKFGGDDDEACAKALPLTLLHAALAALLAFPHLEASISLECRAVSILSDQLVENVFNFFFFFFFGFCYFIDF